MRAIKIDSENKTVIEVNLEKSESLAGMQAIVGGWIEKAMELDNNDTVYVNEEGLFGEPKFFFEIEGGHQPFAGNGVIAGHNPRNGETTAAESSLSDIKAKVKFLSVEEVRRKYRI